MTLLILSLKSGLFQVTKLVYKWKSWAVWSDLSGAEWKDRAFKVTRMVYGRKDHAFKVTVRVHK